MGGLLDPSLGFEADRGLKMFEILHCPIVGLLDLGLGVRSQNVSGTNRNRRHRQKQPIMATVLRMFSAELCNV